MWVHSERRNRRTLSSVIFHEKQVKLKLFGVEVYYTNSSISPVQNVLRGKFHCHKSLISFPFHRKTLTDLPHLARVPQKVCFSTRWALQTNLLGTMQMRLN